MAEQRDKNPNAVALGKLGAKARAQKLTPERRRQIAQKAIQTRWAKRKKGQSPTPVQNQSKSAKAPKRKSPPST